MDRTEIFKFLVYQQFYLEKNIITDRRKEIRVIIPQSSLIISKMVESLNKLIVMWNEDRDFFLNSLSKLLGVEQQTCLTNITNNFGFNLRDHNTWTGFDDDQVFVFTCTEFYKEFYSLTTRSAYESIAEKEWDMITRRSLLANEYSFLLNILYFIELAKKVDGDTTEAEKIKHKLLPFYKNDDFEEYQKELNNFAISSD